jgi:hypothetical protein
MTTCVGPIRGPDGKLHVSDEEMAKVFNDFLGGPTLDKAFVTSGDVKRAIRKANRLGEAGPDGLHMAILAEACNMIANPLAILYNQIFQSGCVPESFKEAKVKPLHKKKSRDQLINYRPLSMSNHIGKIWECLLKTRMVEFLEVNSLLSQQQHGFRPNRGTFSNMMELWEYVMQQVDKHRSLVEMWSFDLTKAFCLSRLSMSDRSQREDDCAEELS